MMKRRFFLSLLFSYLLVGFAVRVAARRGATAADTIRAIRTFTFAARFIQPASGAQVYLGGSDYTVTVTPDSIVCDLPYRGVAYTAPLNPREIGLTFISRKFSHTSTIRRKGFEVLRIEPADAPGILWLEFSIPPKGNTYLRVMPAQAQIVSFTGEIE